ncbi:MAG: TIGR01212 family radical SAM protein [Candidatus Azobacteroides sp.]|nr:TIGR01212 family radical SAM protein [Candidatus Azobacteroides sp.]
MKEKRYKDLNFLLKKYFQEKVQKISVHAGFTCPNRDGSKGTGGCTYCNNQTFSPEYCLKENTITEQLEKGIHFFARKYPAMKYLAYFQSYTNTYAELKVLMRKYEEALRFPGVVGLIIGTRPDCMPGELLDYLEELSKKYFLLVEYGVESTLDKTLHSINRGHNYKDVEKAVLNTVKRGILTGVHLILGLPGESREEILLHSERISALPLTTLKLHQLQLIKGTRMEQQYKEAPELFHFYTVEEYVELVIDFIEKVNPEFILERFVSQSPRELLIYPDWGLKNYEFTAKVEKRLQERNTWQGRLFLKRDKS